MILPAGLVLDAIENKDGSYLAAWADELRDHQIHTVNMLGCMMAFRCWI